MKSNTNICTSDANVSRLALRFLMERQRADGWQDQPIYIVSYLSISEALFGFAALPELFLQEAFAPEIPQAWFAGQLPAFPKRTRRVTARWIKHLQRQRNRKAA